MTLDEGTDDEAERHSSNNKCQDYSGMDEETSNGKSPMAKVEAIGECSTKATVPSLETVSEQQMMCPKESAHAQPDGTLLSANKYQDRSAVNRQSTGTLNRLILVAQALESEVDWRQPIAMLIVL